MSPRPAAVVALLLTGPALFLPPASSAAQVPTCAGKQATIVGTEAGETLVGTPGPDVIVAAGGDDSVESGGGADVVCGGAGDDRLDLGRRADLAAWVPGDGLDTVVGGPGHADVLDITGTAGDDEFTANLVRDDIGGALSVTLSGAGATLHGVETVTAWMGDGADVFNAQSTRLSLTQFFDVHTDAPGADGPADVLEWRGYRGADTVHVRPSTVPQSASVVAATSPRGERYFRLISTDPADGFVVAGARGNDSITYEAADGRNAVHVSGRTARSVVVADTVHTGPKDEQVPDTVLRSPERLAVLMGSGRDTADLRMLHTNRPVVVAGGGQGDVLMGSDGPDRFRGGFDDDQLDGGAGDDWLDGGPDTDDCVGGQGQDQITGCE